MNSRYIDLVKNLIAKYFAEGKADKLKTEGIAELKLLLKRYNIPYSRVKPEINPMIKQIESDLKEKFTSVRLDESKIDFRQELGTIIQRNKTKLTEQQSKIKKITSEVLMKADTNWEKDLERQLRKIKLEDRHIDTEIYTTQLALDNLARAANYKDGMVPYLRYSGPSGTVRPFCEEHIDKIYRYDEVENMTNAFGQPALVYCGGFNCRHRWDAIMDESEYLTSLNERKNN